MEKQELQWLRLWPICVARTLDVEGMVMLLTETVLLGCAHPYSTTVLPAGMVMSLEEVAALNKVSQRVKEEYTCTCGHKEGVKTLVTCRCLLPPIISCIQL